MIQTPQYTPAYTSGHPVATGASAVSIQIYNPQSLSAAPMPAPQYDKQIYAYPQNSLYNPDATAAEQPKQ